VADQAHLRVAYPTAPLPLVGREREQATLRDALAAALAGRGSLVLIGGEAGIGKTALAEALLVAAEEQGACVLVGRCYDLSETPPYGPWAEALDRVPTDDNFPALPRAVLPSGRDGAALASQETILHRVSDYLTALAARHPLILLLDDLHWADPASLDLLRILARGLDQQPILVLATYRADEVADDHALAALLPLLVREARAARLDLRPLDQDAIGILITTRYGLGVADRDRLAGYLSRRTEGNALFLGELLRTLESAGMLHQSADRWLLGDLAGVPVPPLLRQVIAGRLARLGDEDRRLLAVAAVLGQEPPFALWATVAEVEAEALLATAERTVAVRVLEPTDDGVRFTHALIRETLYAGVLAPRRRTWHQRAAEALLATPHPDPDAVAHHLRRAGDPHAFDWLIAAGERAWRAHAWVTAAARYEAALALPLGEGVGLGRRALLLLTLAQLCHWSDPARGLAAAEEAARLADGAGDRILAAAARFDQGALRSHIGNHRAGLAEMEHAWPVLARLSPPERARLPATVVRRAEPGEDVYRGMITLYLAAAGRGREALDLGIAGNPADAASAPGLQQGLAMAHALLGEPDKCWLACAAARAAYHAADRRRNVATLLIQELEWATHYRGDQPAALGQLAAEAEQALVRADAVAPRASPRLPLLPVFWLTGRWDEAREVARLASAPPIYRDWSYPGPWFGRVTRAQGDRDSAWTVLRRAMPGGPGAESHAECAPALAWQCLGAELALDAGDLPLAHAWLTAHDRLLAQSGAVLGASAGRLGWAAYHRAKGDLALAHQHAEAALARATDPRQPLALLAARRLLGELDTVAGHHAAAAAHLDAALALADACAAPYERALCLLALAELRAATADRGEAGTTLAEARVTFTGLGARPALARAEALSRRLAAPCLSALPNGLSPREAEVLALLAAGQSNGQIAAALFLSPRTVQRHVANLYLKIGAHNRADATAYALRHHLT
jgi:DNA-binding CsgD family transcriptional regulator